MHKPLLVPGLLLSLLAITGCATKTSFVRSDTALGRVVIYRNGIAYFERHARVNGELLRLAVPADKVDDFLKSLTVVDTRTGEPPPIAYPTKKPGSETGLIDMEVRLKGNGPHDLLLTYVTEAPAWKPSYRMVVEKGGKVSMQGWAVVDNTSGEDWLGVKLGVGSSSALSFRYDLGSVRLVQRETLQADDLFAQAPPMGGATHGGVDENGNRIVSVLSDATIAFANDHDGAGDLGPPGEAANAPARPKDSRPKPRMARSRLVGEESQPEPAASELDRLAQAVASSRNPILIQGYAGKGDGDKLGSSLARANRVRDELMRRGVRADRVVAQGTGEAVESGGEVRIVEGKMPSGVKADAKPAADAPGTVEPIGASHFESTQPMNVLRGTSAMVSILHADTSGEIVYLYDPETPRGNAAFPFRSVRVQNPTDSTLESGPVTVIGQGKFIGEGLCEPIPARSVGFVPFALDRQIVVDREDKERDEISRIMTVQRGVLSTEIQHTRRFSLTLQNRLPESATVYIRHTVAPGYRLVKGPEARERLGASDLFRVEIGPNGKAGITIEEATPIFKTVDIRSQDGIELVEAYLSSAEPGPLRSQMDELLKLHREMADVEQQIQTTREQMGEYRTRMDELHAQLVTLRAVKTAGTIMHHLEKKLSEMTDKLSTATIDIAQLEEKLMLARIRFQDGVAELSLEKKATVRTSSAADKPGADKTAAHDRPAAGG